jgi:hypothetical protein
LQLSIVIYLNLIIIHIFIDNYHVATALYEEEEGRLGVILSYRRLLLECDGRRAQACYHYNRILVDDS